MATPNVVFMRALLGCRRRPGACASYSVWRNGNSIRFRKLRAFCQIWRRFRYGLVGAHKAVGNPHIGELPFMPVECPSVRGPNRATYVPGKNRGDASNSSGHRRNSRRYRMDRRHKWRSRSDIHMADRAANSLCGGRRCVCDLHVCDVWRRELYVRGPCARDLMSWFQLLS